MELGHVQLSQSVMMTTVEHTPTYRRTDEFLLWHHVRTPLLVESGMRQDVLILAAGRVSSRKNKRNKSRRTQKTPRNHEIHSSRATATTSRRRATKDVPRVSPYSQASIDPGFVEIDHVQLSQSVTTTNVVHTHTDTPTQTD